MLSVRVDSLAQAHVGALFNVSLDSWTNEIARFRVENGRVTAGFGENSSQLDPSNL